MISIKIDIQGSIRVCEQQMKLFMAKINRKKGEEESSDVADDKDSLDSNDEQSAESSDECLHIDAQEDTRMKN